MSIEITISKINRELISAFAMLDSWFDRDEGILQNKNTGRWSIADTLEHVMLTNHYLLILIEKGSKKALRAALEKDLTAMLADYRLDSAALEQVGEPGVFHWHRPEHMEPSGTRPLAEVRAELRQQLYRCLCQLDLLCHGQGIAYRMTMSVNQLGKLDVYQYIYFLALHVKRHLSQMEKQTSQHSI
jgi:hypothetical protein